MNAFGQLYERYYRDVYRFALFLTGDRARAEDLAADTFVRAWSARDRIRQPTVRAYLLTIARNLYRDQRRARPPVEVALEEQATDRAAGPALQAEQRSELRQLRTRLKAVAPGDRRAFLLYVVREMSYEQIAVRLGISIGAVKSRIARARDGLRMPAAAGGERETPS